MHFFSSTNERKAKEHRAWSVARTRIFTSEVHGPHLIMLSLCVKKKKKNTKEGKRCHYWYKKMNSLCPGYGTLYRLGPGVYSTAFRGLYQCRRPCSYAFLLPFFISHCISLRLQLMYTHSIHGRFFHSFSFSITAAPQITTFFFPSPLIAVSNWGRELISSRFFFSSSPFLYIYLLLRGMLFFFLFQHPPLFPPSRRDSLSERVAYPIMKYFFLFVRGRERCEKMNPQVPNFPFVEREHVKDSLPVPYTMFWTCFFPLAFLSPKGKKRKRIRSFTDISTTKGISRSALHLVRWSWEKEEWSDVMDRIGFLNERTMMTLKATFWTLVSSRLMRLFLL